MRPQKVIRFYKTGGPEVLRAEDGRCPEPIANEVLIRVRVVALSQPDLCRTQEIMNKLQNEIDLPTEPLTLPIRRGRRPTTIRGPLHVQCSDNGDENLLRELVGDVAAWPGIEASPSPVGSGELVSLRVNEGLATDDRSVFITGKEFGRVLFGAPTIYLTLPLSCAHWAIVRGWAEPHFCSSFGLVPPGVMVVYTPRDEPEKAVCRSLFRTSYTYSLREPIGSSAERSTPWDGSRSRNIQELA
jgi:hypothetical protein